MCWPAFTKSDEEGVTTYDRPWCSWKYFFRFIAVLALLVAITGVGLGAWAVMEINDNILTDIQILESSVKRDDLEWPEEVERAVASGGMSFQKVGQKLVIANPSFGLSFQKAVTRSNSAVYYGFNTGTISIEPGTSSGMTIEAAPATRTIYPTGTRYTVKTTAVQSIAVAAKKRGVVNEGLLIGGTNEALTIQNTGVISVTPTTGLINDGDSQNLDLKVANPFIFISRTFSHTDLASGVEFSLYNASSVTATYRIISLASVATGGTNFSGGDRIINIGTSSVQKWFISANAAATTGTTSLVMSSVNTGIQASTTSDAITDTTAGANIVAKYSGGTTDYTAGVVVLSIIMIQTAY